MTFRHAAASDENKFVFHECLREIVFLRFFSNISRRDLENNFFLWYILWKLWYILPI